MVGKISWTVLDTISKFLDAGDLGGDLADSDLDLRLLDLALVALAPEAVRWLLGGVGADGRESNLVEFIAEFNCSTGDAGSDAGKFDCVGVPNSMGAGDVSLLVFPAVGPLPSASSAAFLLVG